MIVGDIHDRIPTREECYELMKRHSMLPNIFYHSLQVMRVSLALVDNLKDDVSINRDLVISAALLHDITKSRSLETKEQHDISGGELLRELGFHTIATIVEQHVIFQNYNPRGRLEEREIIYYADKRVMHDKIVTISERAEDLIQRYGAAEEVRILIMKNMELVLDIEKKINSFLEIDIHDAIQGQG